MKFSTSITMTLVVAAVRTTQVLGSGSLRSLMEQTTEFADPVNLEQQGEAILEDSMKPEETSHTTTTRGLSLGKGGKKDDAKVTKSPGKKGEPSPKGPNKGKKGGPDCDKKRKTCGAKTSKCGKKRGKKSGEDKGKKVGKGKGTSKPIKGGHDIVVYNDVNLWEDENLKADDSNTNPRANINNANMVRNLVSFTNSCPRGTGRTVLVDNRDSRCDFVSGCDSGLSTVFNDFRKIILTELEFNLEVFTDSAGYPEDGISCDVKVVFLWLPTSKLSAQDTESLKAFADEGGRIVYVGERGGFYGSSGTGVEDPFLADLGVSMRYFSGNFDSGNRVLPAESIREHPITNGVHNLTTSGNGMGGVTENTLGPCDIPLFYDTSNTNLLAAVGPVPEFLPAIENDAPDVLSDLTATETAVCDEDDPDCTT